MPRRYTLNEALLVAPLAGVCVYAAGMALATLLHWHGHWDLASALYAFPGHLVFGLIFGGPVAYVVEIAVGLPYYLYLERRGPVQPRKLVMAGAVIGGATFPVPFLLLFQVRPWSAAMSFSDLLALAGVLAFGGLVGASVAATFWRMMTLRELPTP